MHSMTGFGRGEASNDQHIVSIELSSVNRKQAEVAFSMPRILSELEASLRKEVLKKVSRGRVNVQVILNSAGESDDSLTLDFARAKALEAQFKELSQQLNRDLTPSISDFINTPGIFTSAEIDIDGLSPTVHRALSTALDALISMRSREGQDLLSDTTDRLQKLEQILTRIEEQAPQVLSHYRTQLITKLQDAQIGLDNLAEDERIIKEVALFADRSDISEEITRFRSHLDKFHEYLASNVPVGRSLDFLCQELNRELNTIGSKANNADLAHLVVTGKTEVEKIREQIQNVE